MSAAIVIKVGGSLIPGHARGLCAALDKVPPGRKLVLIAGGGRLVDVIRNYRFALRLSDATTYAMALLAMDQHAFLLAELGGFPLARTFDELHSAGPVCVLAPAGDVRRYSLVQDVDVDRLTSDAIAALIAARLGASLVIATDVDGIYDRDPALSGDAALLARVAARDLKHRTSIDVEAAAAIERFKVQATVLNGTKPHVLAGFLSGIDVRRTEIEA